MEESHQELFQTDLSDISETYEMAYPNIEKYSYTEFCIFVKVFEAIYDMSYKEFAELGELDANDVPWKFVNKLYIQKIKPKNE